MLVSDGIVARDDQANGTSVNASLGGTSALDQGAAPPSPTVIPASAIADLIREGCRVVTPALLGLGTPVTVMIPGLGAVAARITAIMADGYCCIFDEALPAGAVTVAAEAAERGDDGTATSPIARDSALANAKWSGPARAAAIIGITGGGWAIIALAWHVLS